MRLCIPNNVRDVYPLLPFVGRIDLKRSAGICLITLSSELHQVCFQRKLQSLAPMTKKKNTKNKNKTPKLYQISFHLWTSECIPFEMRTKRQGCLQLHLFNIVLKVLANSGKQRKKKLQVLGREKQNCHYSQIIWLYHRNSNNSTNYFSKGCANIG